MTALQLKIPPPVYLLVFATLMYIADSQLPLVALITAPYHWLAILPALMAVMLDGWALWAFRRARTTVNPLHPERATALVTSGPYRFTRNPMYVGILLLLSAWAVYLGSASPWFFLPLAFVTLTVQQIMPEEKILAQTFADGYRAYQDRVPRWL